MHYWPFQVDALLWLLAVLCYHLIVLFKLYFLFRYVRIQSPHLFGKKAAYSVHYMSFVYSHQSRCDSFTDLAYNLIVSVPDIALLNFQVNKYLVYLDVCNLLSELS